MYLSTLNFDLVKNLKMVAVADQDPVDFTFAYQCLLQLADKQSN